MRRQSVSNAPPIDIEQGRRESMMTAVQAYVPLVNVYRSELPESTHFGAIAVATAQGELVASLGDTSRLGYPRSSLKPFQALALIESGAADAFRLTPRHLALASASHRAEPFQVEIVEDWLKFLGLAPEALACGPAWPKAASDRDARLAAGEKSTRLCHNCSGKHAGMLSVCRHMGYSTHDYVDPAHPLQLGIVETLSTLLGRKIETKELGIDGCNLPAIPATLREMATAAARFASGLGTTSGQSEAMLRILDAMRQHPDHVCGRGQPTQRICEATNGRIVVKTGAEGYLVAWLPTERLGIAIKTADGGERARFIVLIEVIARLNLITRREQESLSDLRTPVLLSSTGRIVGYLAACIRETAWI